MKEIFILMLALPILVFYRYNKDDNASYSENY